VLAMVFWVFLFLLHCVQSLGYVVFGLQRRYLASRVHWFNLFVLLLRGCVTLAAFFMRLKATQHQEFRTAFGIVVYLSWTKTLISLRQLKTVAIRILPITSTMWDVGPFVCVVFVYLAAFANMYYAMGFYPFQESFMMMYRLGILGDFDMLALENVESPMFIKGNYIEQRDPQPTSMHHVVELMMIYMSFVMTVTMMNLFIAMLCLSYSTAAANAETAFLRSRTNIVLDLHAMHCGARRLVRIAQCRKRRRLPDSGSGATSSASDAAVSSGSGGISTRSSLGSRQKTVMGLCSSPSGSLRLSTPKSLLTERATASSEGEINDAHVWFCKELEFKFA
jgi:hypothetical protein